MPIFSPNPCKVAVSQADSNELGTTDTSYTDITYLDPPYNKHPYSIYYFLLDIINNWDTNVEIPNTNRGQPKNWTKSAYNSFTNAESAFRDLVSKIKSKFIILSYNNKGIYPSLGSEGISESHQEIPNIYHMISKTLMEYRDDLKQSVVEKRIWETHKNQCEEYIQSIDSNESFLTSKIKDLKKSRELYEIKYRDNIEKRSDPHTAIERAAERAQIVVQSIQDEHLSYDKGKI